MIQIMLNNYNNYNCKIFSLQMQILLPILMPQSMKPKQQVYKIWQRDCKENKKEESNMKHN